MRDTYAGPENSQTYDKAIDTVRDPAFDQEAIAVLAYLYEARGCPHDSPDEDWFRAEAELRGQIALAATA
jgi:hypothetical protein